MPAGMQVTSLFGFEELCSDCEGGAVPPQPTEQVGSTRCFSNPTTGRQFRSKALQIESVHAFFGYRHVSTKAEAGGISAEMKIQRRRLLPDADSYGRRKIAYGVPNGHPGLWVRHVFRRV